MFIKRLPPHTGVYALGDVPAGDGNTYVSVENPEGDSVVVVLVRPDHPTVVDELRVMVSLANDGLNLGALKQEGFTGYPLRFTPN